MSIDVNLYAKTYIDMVEKLQAAFESEGEAKNGSKPDWAYQQALVGAHHLTQDYLESLPRSGIAEGEEENN